MAKRKASPEIIPTMSDEEIDAIEANMVATKSLSASDLGSLFAQARAFNEIDRMYAAYVAQHAALVAASQRFAEAITMDEMEDAHSALIAAALAVQPDASVARGEGEGT